jgi:hypothetical protein
MYADVGESETDIGGCDALALVGGKIRTPPR